MLSAEHVALQSRLLQQLQAIKQKELDYMMARFEWIAFLMSIIIMIAATTLVSVDGAGDTVRPSVTWLFFLSSILCIFSCAHVCIMCLYLGNWAMGLALRGPVGSLNRAFDIVMLEKDSIEFWLSISILSCCVQTIMSVWVLTNSLEIRGYDIICTVMGAVSTIVACHHLRAMNRRFFRPQYEQVLNQQQKQKAAGEAKKKLQHPGQHRASRVSFAGDKPKVRHSKTGKEMEMDSLPSIDARFSSASATPSTAGASAQRRGSIPLAMKQLAAQQWTSLARDVAFRFLSELCVCARMRGCQASK